MVPPLLYQQYGFDANKVIVILIKTGGNHKKLLKTNQAYTVYEVSSSYF